MEKIKDLYYSVSQLYTFVIRFCYYGYHAAKYTRDYDANGVHVLINTHLKRVSKFMHNPKLTHLKWSEDLDGTPMRQLREVTKLSKIVADDNVGHHFSDLHDEQILKGLSFLERLNDPEYKRKASIAIMKDRRARKGLEDRYWKLLRNKVPGFWD